MSKAVWVMPIYENADRNVWIMIAQAKKVRMLRAFSTEPTRQIVEYNRKLLEEKLDEKVSVSVYEVGVDFFDDEEIENVGC